jgi:hypothetical protein
MHFFTQSVCVCPALVSMDVLIQYVGKYIFTKCVRVCVWFLKSFTALSASGQLTPLEFAGEYSTAARRGGGNLNCTLTKWAIFSHPCTMYRQLTFWVQSWLDGLCKRAKFQVRFRPDIPDHSLVSPQWQPFLIDNQALNNKHDQHINNMVWNFNFDIQENDEVALHIDDYINRQRGTIVHSHRRKQDETKINKNTVWI